MPAELQPGVEVLGRYAIHGKIASGGMASVYYGRQLGDAGFSRVVAIKRMLARYARDRQFVAMFLDEATLASRIRHPNVVTTLDLVADGHEILIVMEYVRGLSLWFAEQDADPARRKVPVDVAASIMMGVLAGLHAAHEARGMKGESLGIVHRDVSPHNILVGADGVSRVTDFGIAKASRQLHVTQEGQIKGKLSYMAPEQLASGGRPVDRVADVFASGVVLWGMLAGERLFRGSDVSDTVSEVLGKKIPPLSSFRSDVPPALEAALHRALERDRNRRWPTARAFEEAIADACPKLATARAVADWVENMGGALLAERDAEIARIESTSDDVHVEPAAVRSDPEPTGTGGGSGTRTEAPTLEWAPPAPAAAVPIPPSETTTVIGPPPVAIAVPPAPISLPPAPLPFVVSEPARPRGRSPRALAAGVVVLAGAAVVFVALVRSSARPDAPSTVVPVEPATSGAANPTGDEPKPPKVAQEGESVSPPTPGPPSAAPTTTAAARPSTPARRVPPKASTAPAVATAQPAPSSKPADPGFFPPTP